VLSKLFLGFSVDFMEPLFGAVSTIAIPIELILQLRNMIFGGSQLLRNLPSCRYRVPGIIFRDAGCFINQSQNGLAGRFESVSVVCVHW
jgi:hypothetical protein